MISRQSLTKAAEKGIINQDQVEPLYLYLSSYDDAVINQGEDRELRFVRSFGDIFITIGILLVVFSVTFIGIDGYYYFIPAVCFIAVAEWLVRGKRLVLPGIALLLSVIFFIYKALPFTGPDNMLVSVAVITVTSYLYYLRYKLPFTLLPMTIGIITIISLLLEINLAENTPIFSFFGICVFVIAMYFDSRDRSRQTRLSDCAFWLHLLAAPLIAHGAMKFVITYDSALLQSIFINIAILVLFIFFFLLALFVDRRAMLVSSLSYALYAAGQLIKDQLVGIESITALVFMSFGVMVVFFGTYWYKTRSLVFHKFADSYLAKFVPDINITKN